MLVILALAFVAGVLTILAPCTLPVVPLVLGSTITGGRGRVVGVMAGFGLTFVATTVVLASALAALGLTTDLLRLLSGIVLALMGLTLVVGPLGARIGGRLTGLAGLGTTVAGRPVGDGMVGGLIVGAAIGLVWAPCVGPIMAGVIALALTRGPSVETVAIASAYAVGAGIPLALVATWGRRALGRIADAALRVRLQRGLGAAMIVAAALLITGLDLTLETRAAAVLADGWSSPPAIEPATGGQQEMHMTATPSGVALDDLGPAPELTGITAWINSDPLTIVRAPGQGRPRRVLDVRVHQLRPRPALRQVLV